MPSAHARIRRYLGRLLLLVVPLVLAFGAAELVLRLAGQPDFASEESVAVDSRWLKVEKSAELGWIFPPDTTGVFRSSGRHTPVATNSWGLRGAEASTDTLTRRVLILGDSYTFGWGVDDEAGFVRLLETALRRETPETPVECINGGLPGYSIYQQIRMLDYVRQRTRIHAVVATISLANDPIDEQRIRRFAPDHLADFSYDLRDPASRTARLIGASHLLSLVDERTTNLQFSLINTNGECRDLASESLIRLVTVCRKANLPLVWVIVPRAQEIRSGGFLRRVLNRATDQLRRHFLELAADQEVPILDLKPALMEVQAVEDAYLPRDAHWNEAGHRAVAAGILPLLVDSVAVFAR
jgi:lysophospholipase L1-like esterase